jgi:uncharacterized membrane protein
MAAYREIDESFPARIMAMAEANAETERNTAERAQTFQLVEGLLGRLFGFVFAMTAIVAAAYLALHDQAAIAGVIGGTTVIGVVVALIKGKAL